MKYHFIGKIIIACLFINYCAVVLGNNHQGHVVKDSINVARLYEVNSKENPYILTLNTDEQTTQVHDGQIVFRTKRQVEYKITKTDTEIIIKRKVLHTEKSVLVKDKDIQNIYPNVTSAHLCGLLKPGKLDIQTLRDNNLECSISESGDEAEIILNKTSRLPKREENFIVDKVRYDDVTEKLQYKSDEDNYFLDNIKTIVTRIDLSVIPKRGTEHKVEIVENINIIH